MAAQDFFTWGEGGARLTPEQLAQRRLVLKAMKDREGDTSPVQHWTQGLARVADALGNNFEESRLGKAETELGDYNKTLISDAYAAMKPQTAPAAIPTSGASAEISSSSPAIDPSIRDGIVNTASALGIDPVDLGTAISYETAGTFDPMKAGPTTQWGQHKGLIQFGEPQAKQYGVNWDDPVGSQLGPDGAIAKYLKGAGVQPGMGMMDIYSAINAGRVGREGASDANNGGAPGTVADKVNEQMSGHRQKAMALLAATQGPQAAIEAISPTQGGSLTDEVAAFEQTPAYSEQFPGQQPTEQPAMAAQQPTAVQQVAQVLSAAGQAQPAVPGMSEALLRAISDPRATPQTKAVAQALMQQQAAQQAQAAEQQQWLARQQYEQAQKRNDPAYRMGLEKSQLEIENLRAPPLTPGDKLAREKFDYERQNTSPELETLYDEKTGQEYKARFNRETGQFERVGGSKAPSGTSLSVGPNGEVQFTQGAGKALTEGQSKDAFFTTRMTAATPTLDAYESALMSLSDRAAGAVPFNLGNYAQSQEYQLARDAGRDFVTAYLRKDSGAALTPAEEKMYGEMLLPQPGDKAATIEAKRTRRAIATEAIKSGMPVSALDNVVKAIKAVPGADQAQDMVPTDIPGVKIRRKN